MYSFLDITARSTQQYESRQLLDELLEVMIVHVLPGAGHDFCM